MYSILFTSNLHGLKFDPLVRIDILINPLIYLDPCRYVRLIRPPNWSDHRGINETLGGEFTHIREIEREQEYEGEFM